MFIYIVIFLLAFLLSAIAEKMKNDSKRIYVICTILAILIPAVMAGLRASGVGTDTKVYIDWVFKSSVKSKGIVDIFIFIKTSKVEPLYCLLNFIVSRFTNNLSIMYFLLELIFLTFSYLACKVMSKKLNISCSFTYLVILLLFFNKSLNLCRQSLSMAICLFSLQYILSRDWKKFFLLMILALGFHNSSVLFIPLYFIYPITISEKNSSKAFKILSLIVLVLCIVFFKQIVVLLVSKGIISSKFLNYVYLFGKENNIKFIEIITQLGILIITLLFSKNLKLHSKYNDFFIYIAFLSFITFLFGFNASYSQRISYYFSMCLVFVIPQFISSLSKRRDQFFMSVLVFVVLCTYSCLYYGKYSFDQTVPYIVDVSENKLVD